MSRIDDSQRRRIFGAPCTTSNLRTYLTPWGMRVQAHSLIVPRLAAACDLAKRSSTWIPRRIDSYACRDIRGSTATSLHAYGLAWDFFATAPGVEPAGGVWTPVNGVPASFASAFQYFGFEWGAGFSRPDVPHIEWCDGRPASVPPAPTPAPPLPTPSPITLTEEDDMLIAGDGTSAWLISGGRRIWIQSPAELAALKAKLPYVEAPVLVAATPVARVE